jgi:dipeptidyl-peptidase 4
MKKLVGALFQSMLLIIGFAAKAQDAKTLTLERIFSSNEFRGEWFGQLTWFEEGNAYTTLEQSEAVPGGYEIVKNNTATGERSVLVKASDLVPAGSQQPLEVEDYTWSDDKNKLLIYTNSARVWRLNTKGDYWVLDLATKKLTQLGGKDAKPSTLMFAKFSPDGSKVGYVRDHNIYVESLVDGKITALTTDGTDRIINGTFDWVYEEEFGCRDGFQWSPDGSKIAYWRIDARSIRNFLMINNTDSIYSYTIPVEYPKAGEKPSEAKIGVVSAAGGPTQWMNIAGDPTNNYVPRMIWNADSKSLLVQQLNRQQNHNQVLKCFVADGRVEKVYEEKDPAWLDAVDDFQLMNKGKSFTWVSEKSGWRSAYLITGSEEKLISPAGFDMINIEQIDEKGEWLYFMASPDNATQNYLYRIRLSGKGKAERLSPADQPGTHSYEVAPNGKYAQHSYSREGVPPIMDLVSLPDHKVIKTFVTNKVLAAKVEALSKNKTEFFQVTGDNGVTMDAYMIKPVGFDPSKKYPVLFHVYGEPAGQTVRDAWGGSGYLWHLMLAQQGYIIMSVDNRGTPGPKGREWRKCVYGQIGVLSSEDQAAALRKIKETYSFVDGDRIGIWGWSGGGSMTLNMMFRYPDLYHTGMSVAPVADQHLYDNIYQERYSGVPQLMPESYEKGSPVNFAKNLKGNLLVMHGTGDDNVHYQNTEVLVNELIRYNKIFSMMSYPNRSHGIYEGRNTSRHVREILTNYLKNNLPAGPR